MSSYPSAIRITTAICPCLQKYCRDGYNLAPHLQYSIECVQKMRPTVKPQLEPTARVINLGGPLRQPLSPLLNTQSSLTCSLSVTQPRMKQTLHVSTIVRPNTLVRHIIGTPIQIMVPVSKLQGLEQEIRQLRNKCEQLQTRVIGGNMNQQLKQLALSSQQIESHIETVMEGKPFGHVLPADSAATHYIEQQSYCIGNDDHDVISRLLQDTEDRIASLEQSNQEANQKLAYTLLEVERCQRENKELRERLAHNH